MNARSLLVLPVLLLAACGAPGPQGGPGVTSWGVEEDGPGEVAALPRFQDGHLIPGSLKGLSAAQLEAGLGRPAFRRRDPPAEIWQYRVKSCTLDLFLYDEKTRDDKVLRRVAHYAVRNPGGGAIPSDQACLDEVLAARVERPVS